MLFNFPSRYLFAIGLATVFSRRWSLPPTSGCIPKQPDSEKTRSDRGERPCGPDTRYGTRPRSEGHRRPPTTAQRLPYVTVRRAPKARGFDAGQIPIHSPLLKESRLVSFPPLNNMLKFSGCSRLNSGRTKNVLQHAHEAWARRWTPRALPLVGSRDDETGEVGRARWRPAVAATVRTRSWRCDAPAGAPTPHGGPLRSRPTGSVGGDPEADVLPGWTRERNSRSEGRRSMCSAIRANYRILLRPSSTREPSDPPLRVVRVSDALVYSLLYLSLSHGTIKRQRAPSGRRRAATH